MAVKFLKKISNRTGSEPNIHPKSELFSAKGGGDGECIRRSRRKTDDEFERRNVLKGCGDAIGDKEGGEFPGGEPDIEPVEP